MNKWLTGLQFFGVGWYIVIAILLGVLGGRWLDGKLNTEPLFMIGGLLLGVFTAIFGVYKLLPKLDNDQNKRSS